MLRPALLVLGFVSLATCARAADFTVEKSDEGLVIMQGGKLVTEYIAKSGAKPILWPIVGPTGKELTRGWPMRDAASFEKQDHPHHRSLWFTHGSVNGIDFWSESGKNGTIVHKEFLKHDGGETAIVIATSEWLSPDGKKVCEDERTVRVGASGDNRYIDFDVTVKATEGPVTFEETKEGSFGVRVHETMKVDAKQGGKLVNSQGQANGDAWSKPAAWVDYYGPVDGETLGIAIFNHPTSFRYPTTWHVRTYGLFAANPFGGKDFKAADKYGSHTIEKGGSMTLRYRVLLHKGTTEEAKIKEAFAEYAK